MEERRERVLFKIDYLDNMIFKRGVGGEPHGCQEESTPGKRTPRLQGHECVPKYLRTAPLPAPVADLTPRAPCPPKHKSSLNSHHRNYI